MKQYLTLLTAFTLSVFGFHPASAEEEHAEHMLKGYLDVAKALYEDDLATARKEAQALAKHDSDSVLAGSAQKVANAQDIVAARSAFKTLSAEAIKLAEGHGEGEYTVMHCPMVKGGGGDWLSADAEVNNPYFGARMPHCGGPAKK
ncbi:MAG: DUF3347 domain-containing protein [Verrucomicrobiae bacterium]|nr:DUF3347 domain-containing protein [Verrucomicrobiae bacterium]MCB1231213.1 DUF3347 domain-containing protein [Verrucomicrobiae bacterium]